MSWISGWAFGSVVERVVRNPYEDPRGRGIDPHNVQDFCTRQEKVRAVEKLISILLRLFSTWRTTECHWAQFFFDDSLFTLADCASLFQLLY